MKRSLNEVLQEIKNPDQFGDTILVDHRFPPRPARSVPIPAGIDDNIKSALAKRGIQSLYQHQYDAYEAIQKGHDVVLATPTASGKSLCYQLPVLQEVAADPAARALFLFPTKALGQDQVHALLDLALTSKINLKIHTFDGDTPSHVRSLVRKEGQVIVTNPDMLHQGILPHHPSWMSFLRNLKFIVVDELHTYRGVFGSHVANVLRRLQRICRFYGSTPQIIAGSATIGNPKELADRLLERDCTLIDDSGAPVGPKRLLVARPPIVNRPLGIRESYILFARKMLRPFLKARIPTIIFGLSRLNVEIILKYLQDDLKDLRMDPSMVQGYRGGYLPKTRRKIEKGLRDGSVTFVVSTSALELGIDIGSLQACFLLGYPGSLASLWQQAGRAGRRNDLSAVVYIPRSNPLDQFVATDHDFLINSESEHARINPDNLIILAEHLKCAAFELPFDGDEAYGHSDQTETQEMLDTLASYRVLHKANGRYHWTQRTYPANGVSLRSIPGDNFVVVDQDLDELLAEVDFKSAHTTLYEGAIYNLQGHQYEVVNLDYEGHKAFVRKVKPDYYTDAMTNVEVKPLETIPVVTSKHLKVECGDVKITSKVVGFKKIRFHTNENVGYGEVFLPEITLHSRASWLVIPGKELHRYALEAAQALGQSDHPMSAEEVALDVLAGLSHAIHHLAALDLMCDPRDLGRCVGDRTNQWSTRLTQTSQSYALRNAAGKQGVHPFAFDPALFIYDTYPGGVGLSENIGPILPRLLAQAGDLINRCECVGGCPSCIGAFSSPMPILKETAVRISMGLTRSIKDKEIAA